MSSDSTSPASRPTTTAFNVRSATTAQRPRSLRPDINMEAQLERARMDRLQRRYAWHMLDYQSTCATAATHRIFLAAMLGEILRYQHGQVEGWLMTAIDTADGPALQKNADVKLHHLRAALKEIHRQIFVGGDRPWVGPDGRRQSVPPSDAPSTPPNSQEDRYARQLRDISTFRLFDPIKPPSGSCHSVPVPSSSSLRP